MIRYLKYKNDLLKEYILHWFNKNCKVLGAINVVMAFPLIFYVVGLNYQAYVYFFPFMCFTILYMIPVLRFKKKSYSLRKIPGLKVFVISISWAGLSTVFALTASDQNINYLHVLYFLQQFLFVVVLTLPFDIRDLFFDSKELKTLPILMGQNKTKLLGYLLLLIMNGLSYNIFQSSEFFITLVISLLVAFGLFNSNHVQSNYYASFWIEGIPIFWWILIIVVQCFQ
jgi:hypothetical protein